MRRLYGIFAMIILATYAYVDARGLELTPHKKQFVPHGLRSVSHGGYRSFWYSGYHGGK
jgi:hypothetical protein